MYGDDLLANDNNRHFPTVVGIRDFPGPIMNAALRDFPFYSLALGSARATREWWGIEYVHWLVHNPRAAMGFRVWGDACRRVSCASIAHRSTYFFDYPFRRPKGAIDGLKIGRRF